MSTRPFGRPLALLVLLFAATPALADCTPPSPNKWTDWFNTQEENGGHTLACHVNVTINGLIGRIENRGGHQGNACLPGAAASSWSGMKALIDTIGPEFREQGDFFQTSAPGDYVLHGNAGRTIGTTVYAYQGKPGKNRQACPNRSDYVCEKADEWTAVVRITAPGTCFLLTAYPH